MRYRFPYLFLLFCCNPVWADFSSTQMWHHPFYIDDDAPFILDFKGEWPTDCHPGEQKPVISAYTGDTVLIEFEIITEHITCNDTATPYRVLVDMGDVVDDVPGQFPALDVTVRFGGAELHKVLDKHCLMCDPPPPPRDVKPEPGLYNNAALDKQGLIIARQNDRMGVYPLVYDAAGSSEWLFGGGGLVEDVYFARLKELSGGQCLGCLPPQDPPQQAVVGKLSMLVDREGLIQVKINDGLFGEYAPLVFGYGEFAILDADTETPVRVPDLRGRWAFASDESPWDMTTPPPTSVVPLVFDIELRADVDPPLPTIGDGPPVADSHHPRDVYYAILDIEGELVAEMLCEHRGEMTCDLKQPDVDDVETWFEVELLSVERMIMRNTVEPGLHEGIGTGTAVRID